MKNAAFSTLCLLLLAVCLTGSGNVFGAEQEGKIEAKPAGTVLIYEVDRERTSGWEPDMKKVLAAVNRRVNPGWFRRMTVRLAEGNRIEIVVPSTDPADVRKIERMVERIGTIEFRILANASRPEQKEWIDRAKAMRENQIELRKNTGEILAWWVPVAKGKAKGFESQSGIVVRKVTRDRQEVMQVLAVKDPYDVNGSYLTRATPGADPNGRPTVRLAFNSSGAMRFGRLTETHLPDPKNEVRYSLGIMLDGWLHAAPSIMSKISDQAEITGDFTKDEVQELVDVLNAGSLPVVLRKVQSPEEAKRGKADG